MKQNNQGHEKNSCSNRFNAFHSALKIAAKGNTTISCGNVVRTQLDWKRLSDSERKKHSDIFDQEEEAREKLKAFIQEHKTFNTPVEAVVEIGVPHEVIVDTADKQSADLIIIGAYGRGHQEGKFIGSKLQKVLRNAQCPVLAVKKPMNGNDLRKMVFASLFNEESKPAFTRMKPLIKQLRCAVHFLFVNTPNKFVNTVEAEHKCRNMQ